MKKLIAIMLAVVMLASIAVIGVSAADGVYIHTTFPNMEEFMKYFVPGAFFIPDGEEQVFGYYEAKALQTIYYNDEATGCLMPCNTSWMTYDAVINVAVAPDTDGDHRSIEFWYCNDTPKFLGYAEDRQYIKCCYNILDAENQGYFTIHTHNPYSDEEQLLAKSAQSYEYDFESGNEFHNFGISVGANRIRLFMDNQLVCEYNDTVDGFGIAQECVSPVVFWNDGNMVVINEFTAASYGYLYPAAAQTEPTPTQPTEPITSISSSVSEVVVTVTNEKGEVETDENGEVKTEVSEVIVTEIVTVAPADTQNNNGNGGNSTTTGDSAFIVLAVMVATLGCAIIVKKVTVK